MNQTNFIYAKRNNKRIISIFSVFNIYFKKPRRDKPPMEKKIAEKSLFYVPLPLYHSSLLPSPSCHPSPLPPLLYHPPLISLYYSPPLSYIAESNWIFNEYLFSLNCRINVFHRPSPLTRIVQRYSKRCERQTPFKLLN